MIHGWRSNFEWLVASLFITARTYVWFICWSEKHIIFRGRHIDIRELEMISSRRKLIPSFKFPHICFHTTQLFPQWLLGWHSIFEFLNAFVIRDQLDGITAATTPINMLICQQMSIQYFINILLHKYPSWTWLHLDRNYTPINAIAVTKSDILRTEHLRCISEIEIVVLVVVQ